MCDSIKMECFMKLKLLIFILPLFAIKNIFCFKAIAINDPYGYIENIRLRYLEPSKQQNFSNSALIDALCLSMDCFKNSLRRFQSTSPVASPPS